MGGFILVCSGVTGGGWRGYRKKGEKEGKKAKEEKRRGKRR